LRTAKRWNLHCENRKVQGMWVCLYNCEKQKNWKKRWILEVDLEYPKELLAAHNSYLLAREKR